MRLYLDSNVFISFVREEFGRGYRQLGTESELFFAFCKKNEFKLIFSEIFFEEVKLKTALDEKGVCEIITHLGINFIIAKNPKNLKIKAISACKKLSTHLSDAIHYIIALEEKVDALITFNKKDFKKVSEFLVQEPEEFTDSKI